MFDKSLQIDPDYAQAQYYKGTAMQAKQDEPIDKALEKRFTNHLISEALGYTESKGSKKKVKWYTSDGKPVYE